MDMEGSDVKLKPPMLSAVVLLDIEGTTTSICFVKDVLFPYARENMEKYLSNHWKDGDVQGIVQSIRLQAGEDLKAGLLSESLVWSDEDDNLAICSVVKYLLLQMDRDRKLTELKTLQGKIWKAGYANGVLKGHIYDDVTGAFDRWVQSGRKLYIYSSGSVEAQILLFKNSAAGDLTKYLSGHFDTTSGAKVESKSYKTIAQKIGVQESEILFLTDITKEAYAAKEAGLQVTVLIRPGNAPLTPQEMQDFPIANTFDEFPV